MRGALLLVLGVVILLTISATPIALSSSSAVFTVLGAAWGNPGAVAEGAPGSTNIPLTVTIYYSGSSQALGVQGILQLAGASVGGVVVGGFSDVYGNTTTTAVAESVTPGSIFSLTYYLDIGPNTKVGDYVIPLQLDWTDPSSGPGYLVQSTEITVRMLGVPDLTFSASPDDLVPGGLNNVTIAVGNSGSGSASQVMISLSAMGVSFLNATDSLPELGPGQMSTFKTSVFVPTGLSGDTAAITVATTYFDSYGTGQSLTQTLGMYVGKASPPILAYQTSDVVLTPGQVNPVTIALSNLGTGSALEIRTQMASSGQTSILDQFPVIASLTPGSTASGRIEVYVPEGMAGSAISLTISSTYTDEFGNAGTYTQSLGLYASNVTTVSPSVLISVTPVKSSISVGVQSEVTFSVKNVGPDPLESPVLSLAVASPLVVTMNSSYSVPGGVLQPDQSILYEAAVGAGTSDTPGFYSASVTVSYLGQLGNLDQATFTSGLVLTGTIVLVVQSPEVTQGNASLTVSGEILNEGFSSAYYASVLGSVAGERGTSQADYVGEIDPNTPVPFSLTISYAPPSSIKNANISVVVEYEDSLGTVGSYRTSFQTVLRPSTTLISGSTPTSSGISSLTYIEAGVIVILAAGSVVGSIYVHRARRRGTSTGRNADQEVI